MKAEEYVGKNVRVVCMRKHCGRIWNGLWRVTAPDDGCGLRLVRLNGDPEATEILHLPLGCVEVVP